ncbi:Hypothetical predicted protein [Marmota monax]|uniref:Uncharacterized protein n=1 Tax=Marmota monax TaxID=9995 RepID=A0A5E4C8T8_MARMO|nr:Hypothetical predicted protein [Marmota monax]
MAAATCRPRTPRAAGSPGSIVPVPAEAATWDVAPLGGGGRGMARRMLAAQTPRRPAGASRSQEGGWTPESSTTHWTAEPHRPGLSVSAQCRLLETAPCLGQQRPEPSWKVSEAPEDDDGWNG